VRFRKRPVVIEAVQFDGANAAELVEWAARSTSDPPPLQLLGSGGLVIPTLEGDLFASPGDWIIRGVRGEYYPCKPDIFEATYEPAG
jgi:hypothetical protein